MDSRNIQGSGCLVEGHPQLKQKMNVSNGKLSVFYNAKLTEHSFLKLNKKLKYMWQITVLYRRRKVIAEPVSFEKIGEWYLLLYQTHHDVIPGEAVLNITNTTNPNYKFKR